MKVLICSDSHRDIKYFDYVINKEKPELIIFAGDHSLDAIDMSYAYSDIDFRIVRGNCDFDMKTEDTIIFEVNGMGKILLTHGHLYSVKSTMSKIYELGKLKEVDYVIFGHTHIKHKSINSEIMYINPGAMMNKEYAIFENGILEFKGGY